ncbi:MAG TPA: hypothetical protein VGM05_34085 [Planctomycetaceae bacterium]
MDRLEPKPAWKSIAGSTPINTKKDAKSQMLKCKTSSSNPTHFTANGTMRSIRINIESIGSLLCSNDLAGIVLSTWQSIGDSTMDTFFHDKSAGASRSDSDFSSPKSSLGNVPSLASIRYNLEPMSESTIKTKPMSAIPDPAINSSPEGLPLVATGRIPANAVKAPTTVSRTAMPFRTEYARLCFMMRPSFRDIK